MAKLLFCPFCQAPTTGSKNLGYWQFQWCHACQLWYDEEDCKEADEWEDFLEEIGDE